MESVLLLNASFEPIKVITWQRAICLCFSGKVEVVEEYDHSIRSVSLVIKAPAVVRLLKYVSTRRKVPPLSRANVLARDEFRCQYCNKEVSPKDATLDHVVPRSQGGGTSWTNIVCCCVRCNSKKGGYTPKQAGMPLLREPVAPDWLPVITVRFNGRIPKTWKMFIEQWYRI
jgi:5-methylcytosine-specific restriction endonuclease McrA